MSHLPAISFLFLSAVVVLANCVNAGGTDLPYRITTKRVDDKVEFTREDGKAVVSVCSPFGISQAGIERSGSEWPETVTLRLHLKGLEKFKVSGGKVTLEAAVSSQDAQSRIWKDGREDSTLDPKHPYYMEIRMIGKDGRPAKRIPLKEGYFEMQLPQALLEENPKSITLNWVDFYR